MSKQMTFPDLTGILCKPREGRLALQMAHLIDGYIYVTNGIILAKVSVDDLKMIYTFEIEEGVNNVSIGIEALKAMSSSSNIVLMLKKNSIDIIGKGGGKITFAYSDPDTDANKMFSNISEIIPDKKDCINSNINSVSFNAKELSELVKPFCNGHLALYFNNKSPILVKFKNRYNRSSFIIMKIIMEEEVEEQVTDKEEAEIPPTDEAMEKASEQFTDDVVEEESCDGIGEELGEQLNEIEHEMD